MNPEFAVRTTLKPPDGRKAAYEFAEFNVLQHVMTDGRLLPAWEAVHIVRVPLPSPLPYIEGGHVTRVAVHRKAADPLKGAFRAIHDAGLWDYLAPYGGGFEFRKIRQSNALSMHALGLALDFDPDNNPYRVPAIQTRFGTEPEARAVVRLFELYGWAWGGNFKLNPDAQHFQYAVGV